MVLQGSCSSADEDPLCLLPPQAFPDVVSLIQQAATGGSSSLVLDAELVAVDRAAGCRLLAFQELAGRARGEVQEHQVRRGGAAGFGMDGQEGGLHRCSQFHLVLP